MNARSESIEVEQSAFLGKHLIVGDDFSIVAPFVGTPPTGTLQSGVYFVRLQAGSLTRQRKLLLRR